MKEAITGSIYDNLYTGYMIWKRLFAPQRGGLGAADQLFAPQRGGLAAADQLFAPQRGGQEKQLCYSSRSWASKSKITGKVI